MESFLQAQWDSLSLVSPFSYSSPATRLIFHLFSKPDSKDTGQFSKPMWQAGQLLYQLTLNSIISSFNNRVVWLNHGTWTCLQSLKEKLLSQLEPMIHETLSTWSNQESNEVKNSVSAMAFNFATRELHSYDAEIFSQNSREKFTGLSNGFMSFPLNIPGTTYNKCLKDRKAVLDLLSILAEHVAILKERENPNSSITWEEYKSMTFTLQARKRNARIAKKGDERFSVQRYAHTGHSTIDDHLIYATWYTIPKGWMNPDIYKDPLAFNPWRWKDLEPSVISKHYMPFGSGIKHCAGSEYTKLFLAIFIHVLVTKHRWIKIRVGDVTRNPVLQLKNGLCIKILEKND
ncbi:hypothetical protein REPUB_Repub04eG0030500 [Reevesia pubescens]